MYTYSLEVRNVFVSSRFYKLNLRWRRGKKEEDFFTYFQLEKLSLIVLDCICSYIVYYHSQ